MQQLITSMTPSHIMKKVPQNIPVKTIQSPGDYGQLLMELKARVKSARLQAALAANRELVGLYLDIGRIISARQKAEAWGSGIIKKLADDLKKAFPDMKGFSARNLSYMKQAASMVQDDEILQQAVAKLPWGHITVLVDRLKNNDERRWYALKAYELGWSRNIMVMQMDLGLYGRQALSDKVSNFVEKLPPPQSDLAAGILKDPYIFDFLSLGEEAHEREIERELVRHVTEFLLELGSGFAFVGRQVRLTVSDHDYFLDLLFYHLELRCFVVIELKAGEFKPEYAGKLNFYLSAVDDSFRKETDQPTIGLILCKGKDKLMAEYALRGLSQPLAVADYSLTRAIPDDLKGALPTIEELEEELTGAPHEA